MPHYNSYNSFKTKKSVEKKKKAKEKTYKSRDIYNKNFIIDFSDDYGIVIEVKYNDAYILYDNKIITTKLRTDLNMVCNQIIFPGDKVILSKSSNNYIITNIIKRTSLLSRIKKDSTRLNNNIGLNKNIAANIDLAVIVVSSKEPPLHPKFIDRYLMILQNNDINTIICLNKSDLKTEEDDNILNIYKNLNITVIETSTYKNEGIENLKKYLYGKQAIFLGNSGVGKSSLINVIMENDNIKTGNISEKSKRGKHTTTTSKYYIWNDNSSIIDTPGIRSLNITSFKPIEIQEYFSEFDNLKDKCRYKNCLHFNEPYNDCAIKQNINNGINKDRYESYIRIIENIKTEKTL